MASSDLALRSVVAALVLVKEKSVMAVDSQAQLLIHFPGPLPYTLNALLCRVRARVIGDAAPGGSDGFLRLAGLNVFCLPMLKYPIVYREKRSTVCQNIPHLSRAKSVL